MNFLSKKKDVSAEQVRTCVSKVRKEQFAVNRQISKLYMEKSKTEAIIKGYARKNEMDSCRIIAKELIRVNRAISSSYSSIATYKSLERTIKQQLGNMRMCSSVQKSTEVLELLNSMMKVKETYSVAQNLSKEMIKAGIIEEMIDETLNPEDIELEEQAGLVSEQAINEVLRDILGNVKIPIALPVSTQEVSTDDTDLEEIQKRLQSLKEI
ncbi:hypothetical protein MXB_1753 [Myxobolus squamalis]|nr:hypothetical protein MXB_1753 [Myxobolus squamalis]